MIVTLDGPAGSGKSTVARKLAENLGYAFLDTGAMFRAVAYQCVESGISLNDQAAVGNLAETLDLRLEPGRVWVAGKDVTTELRAVDVTVAASQIAVFPELRKALVLRQRQFAKGRKIVTEGRDQGTVVFPKAECKFFLTADPKVRAKRRLRDLQDQGNPMDFEEVLQQILDRDERDATRELAPLVPAEDAVLIDTSTLSLDEVLCELETQVRQAELR